jgi:hypothetical protein
MFINHVPIKYKKKKKKKIKHLIKRKKKLKIFKHISNTITNYYYYFFFKYNLTNIKLNIYFINNINI